MIVSEGEVQSICVSHKQYVKKSAYTGKNDKP